MLCDELKDKWFNAYPEIMGIEGGEPTKCYGKSEVDAAIAELKRENERLNRELEHVKNGDCINTCDVVEKHVKEEIKAKRALWLARANDASSFAGLFSTLSDIEDDGSRTYWIFGNKRKIVIDGLKCSRMETAYKWFCIWDDVAYKCLKKAEADK